MPKLKKALYLFLVTILVSNFLSPVSLQAQITDCDAPVTPNQVASGSTTNFTFTVTNGSAARIRWLKFSRPSPNFTLGTITAIGWTVVSDADSFTISGGSINTGVSRNFTLNNVVAANVNAPSANWSVAASDSSSGTNPFSCRGNMGTQIGTPDVTAPIISNVATSNLDTSSVTISWTTDEPATSRVNYGLTSSYGSNVSDSNLVTSHSLNINNLSPATGYHYQVVSSDASANSASSSDNTFLTMSLPTIPSSNTSGNLSTVPTENAPTQVSPKQALTGDSTAPIVILGTDLSTVFKDAPAIKGEATDNIAVATVEYSLDGGSNWLVVDSAINLGQKKVTFEFKPINLPDDNYEVIIRAKDSSDNFGFSVSSILIIDQMPPLIGPNVISFGPQLVETSENIITAVKGLDEKITLSAQGGPTSIVVKALAEDGSEPKLFSLTRLVDSNLWSGILSFEKEGTYALVATAVDGAKNKVERQLNNVFVGKPSIVLNSQNQKPLNGALVSLYYLDSLTGSWVLWDADSFGQTNPQSTNAGGEFKLFVPAGQYYLQAEAKGFQTLKSDIFTLEKGTPLSSVIEMKPTWSVGFGKLNFNFPDLFFNSFKVNTKSTLPTSSTKNSLEGKELPNFSLPSTSGTVVNSLDLSGKPTVIIFVSTWSPATEEQIKQLEALSRDDYNTRVVFELDSLEKVKAYRRIADYDLDFLVDSAGELIPKLNIQTLPTAIFISRAGTIVKVTNTVLSKKDLQISLDSL